MSKGICGNRVGKFALAIAIVLTVLAAGVRSADAGEATEFHRAVADAYVHYREALFYVQRGNPSVAAFELEPLVEKWTALERQFADDPPEVYANDPKWRVTLESIGRHAKSGLAAALANDAEEAKTRLAPIRQALVELRRRNQVLLFADYVEEANITFGKLFRFRKQPPDFADTGQVDALRKALTDTIHSYKKCRDNAPPAIAEDPQFKRLIKDSLYYLDRMWVAIEEKNQVSVVNILRRVVSSDKILWMRFG